MGKRGSIMRFGLRTVLATATSVLALSQAATAQQAAGQSGGISEIVVTAEKRAEPLSKVPITITALSQDDLDQQGIKGIDDIARNVPGVSLQPNFLGDTNISIRGIQSTVGVPTTGIYIDDVPIAALGGGGGGISNAYPKVFDLERVEVLQGPQGTLFGAGAEGGAVRFITAQPSFTGFSGNLHAELADTEGGALSYETGVSVNAPVVEDKLALRVSAWGRRDGGYIDRFDINTGQPTGHDINSANTGVGHISALFTPTDRLTLTFSTFDQSGLAHDMNNYWQSAGYDNSYARLSQPRTDRFSVNSGTVEYAFDDFTVKSISSYFFRVRHTINDYSFFDPATFLGVSDIVPGAPNYRESTSNHTSQQNWTEELRVSSNGEGPLRWTFGAYADHQKEKADFRLLAPQWQDLVSGLDSVGIPTVDGTVPVNGIYSFIDENLQTASNVAGFGQIDYQVTDKLKVSAGLRVARTIFGVVDAQAGPEGNGATNSASEKDTPVTPKFGISYQVDPDDMLYANAGKGYRIGGANQSVAGNPSCSGDLAKLGIKDVPLTYNSDTLWSYEAGIKAKPDSALQVSASVFWVNWNQIQGQAFLPTCFVGFNLNMGAAQSRGADAQIRYRFAGGWEFNGSLVFDDARYSKDFSYGESIVRAGDMIGTPEWSGSAGLQYNYGLWDDATGYTRADYEFTGPYDSTPSAGTFSYNPYTRSRQATHFVSMRSGISLGTWDAALFVNNLLNSSAVLARTNYTSALQSFQDFSLRPRTVGLSANYKF